MVGQGRIELPTYGLGNRRSVQLSYYPEKTTYSTIFRPPRQVDRTAFFCENEPSMKNIRSFAIVDYVKERRYVSLDELMARFKVSSATIHRDVAELVQRDVLQRVRGGVAFVDNSAALLKQGVAANSFRERADVNKAAKEKIAQLSLARVAEGDILFLDSSTTVAAFADALSKSAFTNLTIVTNSVAAMRFFPKFPPHYVLISLGGSYDPQLNAFLGAATLRELERLTLTKAFVSCFGVNEKIATTNHEAQAGLITRVLDRTDHRYLLADRSKFGRTGLHRLAARGFFDEVITDRPV